VALPHDPWHYLPVLARKPGALRNGDPFRNWDLPPALAQIRRRLAGHDDGDRQFVNILTAVAEAGLDAVEAACAEALSAKLFGRDVVLNILARQRDTAPPRPVATPVSGRKRNPSLPSGNTASGVAQRSKGDALQR
jgi:hypothetical protein